MSSDSDHNEESPVTEGTPTIGRLRVAIACVQGIVAWLLLRLVAPTDYLSTAHPHALYWSERHPMVFAALALITGYVPAIAILELGRMRRTTLFPYLGLVAAALAGLAAYDIWRDPLQFGVGHDIRVWPSFQLGLCAALGLFIINQLLEHRERGYAFFTHYATHFEDSWMRGFQLVVSLTFSLLVWGLLNLGAALFGLIHVTWFETMIEHNWFRCPILAMAFASAIHITDVRPALLKGMRNVVLTLLAWLLPLIVALGVGFLTALVFVGLKPLWATRHAASILLWASALTVFLLNAAYKDGDPSTLPVGFIRWAGRVAGPTVFLLALLASYSIALRVEEYGWTPDRVFSTAIALVALIYGGGYVYAAIGRARWLASLEVVNVSACFVILGILALLLTPVADPARLSVDSQLSRLARGEVSSGNFDYQFLRFDSGIFGRKGLERLARSTDADVRSRAARMEVAKSEEYFQKGESSAPATEPPFSHATIYPSRADLPKDFKGSDWSLAPVYGINCLENGGACEIYVVPYGSKGSTAVVVRETEGAMADNSSGDVFQRDASGKWVYTGSFNHLDCPGVLSALRRGESSAVSSEHEDLMADGVRLEFSAARPANDTCQAARVSNQSRPPHSRDAVAPSHMGPAFGQPGGP
ncbi:MAG: DUF4153 domain-containing protein [Steroidobacteraceae bacterium]